MSHIDQTFTDVKNGIRSKDRVKNLAEVFTRGREVKAMLDLVGDTAYAVETTFLEPACGNGNFLVEILSRKAATIRRRFEAEEYILILRQGKGGREMARQPVRVYREAPGGNDPFLLCFKREGEWQFRSCNHRASAPRL